MAQEHEAQHAIHEVLRFLKSIVAPFQEFDARESAEHLVIRKVFVDKFQLKASGPARIRRPGPPMGLPRPR